MKPGLPRLKVIADLLTYSRLVIAMSIIIVGITMGRAGLSTALLLLLIGWLTDAVDGTLARRDTQSKQTWIGDNDIIVDVLLASSMIVYFSLSGFISIWISLCYFVYLFAVTFLFAGWTLYAISIGFSYGTILLVSLLHSPRFFLIYSLYIVILLVTTRDHCWENIRSFFTGFKAIEIRKPPLKRRV